MPKTVILQVNTASYITMDTRHGVGISRPPRLCCLCVSLNRLFMIVPDACSPQGNGLRNERPISAGNRRRTRRMQHEDSIGCITAFPESGFRLEASERQKTFFVWNQTGQFKKPSGLRAKYSGLRNRNVKMNSQCSCHGFPRQTLLPFLS